MSCLLLIFYLCIGDGGITYGTPVNNTGTLVDVAFFMHLHEYFGHCLVTAFIHGETLSVPVTRRTQLFKLFDNTSAVFLLPLPGSL